MGIWRRVTGSPFQVARPATEIRRCLVAVLERGTTSYKYKSDDEKCCTETKHFNYFSFLAHPMKVNIHINRACNTIDILSSVRLLMNIYSIAIQQNLEQVSQI